MAADNITMSDYAKHDFKGLIMLWEDIHLGGASRGDTHEIIEDTIRVGGKLIVVKEMSGKIIGSSWVTTDKRRNYLHHFGVRDEYRGTGLAQKMLDRSLEFSKKSGLQIKLEVHRDNIRAIRLYEKYKFKYLGDYLVYIIRDYEKTEVL
jgi:ribosomal protein S18 acetylase RimI-like enzyme